MPAASAGGASTRTQEDGAMTRRGIAGLAFAGATAVAMAFGVTQAFAAPAPASSTDARACSTQQCNTLCYPFTGICRGQCLCAG